MSDRSQEGEWSSTFVRVRAECCVLAILIFSLAYLRVNLASLPVVGNALADVDRGAVLLFLYLFYIYFVVAWTLRWWNERTDMAASTARLDEQRTQLDQLVTRIEHTRVSRWDVDVEDFAARQTAALAKLKAMQTSQPPYIGNEPQDYRLKIQAFGIWLEGRPDILRALGPEWSEHTKLYMHMAEELDRASLAKRQFDHAMEGQSQLAKTLENAIEQLMHANDQIKTRHNDNHVELQAVIKSLLPEMKKFRTAILALTTPNAIERTAVSFGLPFLFFLALSCGPLLSAVTRADLRSGVYWLVGMAR